MTLLNLNQAAAENPPVPAPEEKRGNLWKVGLVILVVVVVLLGVLGWLGWLSASHVATGLQ